MLKGNNEEEFINGNLDKLMFSMAIPTIVAQIINILYNIVDRIYIGHIPGASSDALTGVGVALPVIVLISAFSAFVGQGGAPLSSIWLGKGDKEHAEKILGNGTFLLVIFTIILMFIFYIWQKPLLYAFGASSTTISYAGTYLSWYLIGTISVEIALGLNTYIIAQGNTGIAMLSVLAGAVSNIMLDPVFIFVFKMGVKGAAVATVISQTLSAIWVVSFLTGKKALLKIRLSYLAPDSSIIKQIFSLGISPFVMRATESLISIVMNSRLQKYGGDIYVAALTVMQSVMQVFSAPVGGFTQGVQPLVSYNYGAQNFVRVKQIYKKMIFVCGSFSFITTVVVMLFPAAFARIFTTDENLIGLIASKMPLFMCGMLLFGVQMAIQPVFLALGQAKISLIIAMLRKVILLTPLAIIFPVYTGADGVFFAEPVSDFISAITAVILFKLNIGKILSKEKVLQIK
ncbi:MAG: MATE family efflux transporter [Lachnospiraceae bacterium]